VKSVTEQIRELEQEAAAAAERVIALNKDVAIAQFEGSKEDAIQFRERLEAEKRFAELMCGKLDSLRAEYANLVLKMVELERTVFGLATGALALSVTFSGQLIPDEPNELQLLRTSWILLTVSIFAFPTGAVLNLVHRIGIGPR
jgi:hypothetical protein